jgi:hypothetical protein
MKSLKKAFVGGLCGLAGLASVACGQDIDVAESTYTPKYTILNDPNIGKYVIGTVDKDAEAREMLKKEREVRWALYPPYFERSFSKKGKPKIDMGYFCEIIGGEPYSAADAVCYWFYTPKNSWQRMHERIYDSFSGYEGIEVSVCGNSKIILQVELSDENSNSLGEIYEIIIKPQPYWTQYKIPFHALKRRGSQTRLDEHDLEHVCSVGFEFPHTPWIMKPFRRNYVCIKDVVISKNLGLERAYFFNMSGKK